MSCTSAAAAKIPSDGCEIIATLLRDLSDQCVLPGAAEAMLPRKMEPREGILPEIYLKGEKVM